MAQIEAKAKVRARHKAAEMQFRKWCREHPDATRKEKVKAFDDLVDIGAMSTLSNAA